MHRFVSMKLRSKSLGDVLRPSNGRARNEADEGDVPVLELSLPDSKSFRASLILPDLSRRFTLLRTNGELVPIGTFQQHLRHQRELGQITHQDESILLHHYQSRFLDEDEEHNEHGLAPAAHPLRSLSAPPEEHAPSSFSPPISRKGSSAGINNLFSGSASARDAAYLQKTFKMSATKTKAPARVTRRPSEPTISEEQAHGPHLAANEAPMMAPGTASLSDEEATEELAEPDPDPQSRFDDDVEPDIELTPTQFRRMSLAVDRIIDQHLCSTVNRAASSKGSEAATSSVDRMASPSPPTISSGGSGNPVADHSAAIDPALQAESRVHEELFKALSANSSPVPPSPQPSFSAIDPVPASFSTLTISDLSPTHSELELLEPRRCSTVLSVVSETPSNGSGSSFGQLRPDWPELTSSEDGFLDDSASCLVDQTLLEDLPDPGPILDRHGMVTYSELTYSDLVFIQQTLVASVSEHLPPDHASSPAPLAPLRTSPPPPPCHSSIQSADPLRRNISASTSVSSAVDCYSSLSSHDRLPLLPSARSSSLHSRLRKSTRAGIASCQRIRSPKPKHSRTDIGSPSDLSTPDGSAALSLHASPCSSVSPDISSFPLTPPPQKELESVCRPTQSWRIPSPPAGPDHMPSIHDEVEDEMLPTMTNKVMSSIQSPASVTSALDGSDAIEPSGPSAVEAVARPRPCVSRSARPVPTTLLFRDVEAQAVAANAALRKVGIAEPDGENRHAKRGAGRKKPVRTAQIGAPTLLSASADLQTFELERASTPSRQDMVATPSSAYSPTHRSQGTLKGGFKLRLKKKKMSDLVTTPTDGGDAAIESPGPLDHPGHSADGSAPSAYGHVANSEAYVLLDQPRDPAENSPMHQSLNHHSRALTASPTPMKNPSVGPLKSLRRLMGRHAKVAPNNTQSCAKADDAEGGVRLESIEVPLAAKVVVNEIAPLKIKKGAKEHGVQVEEAGGGMGVWPLSAPVVLTHKPQVPSQDSVSKLFNDLGFSPREVKVHGADLSPDRAVRQTCSDSALTSTDTQQHSLEEGETAPMIISPHGDGDGRVNGFAASHLTQSEPEEHAATIRKRGGAGRASIYDSGPGGWSEDVEADEATGEYGSSEAPGVTSEEPFQMGAMVGENDLARRRTTRASVSQRPVIMTDDSGRLRAGRAWLEVHEAEEEATSDYAASILDLYGAESDSPVSSRKRISNLSRYSHPQGISRPSSWLPPAGRGGGHSPGIGGHRNAAPAASLPKRNSTEDEVMVMVHQLQESARYSRFGPARLSASADGTGEPSSFVKNILQGKNLPGALAAGSGPHTNGRHNVVADDDDDDEAEVWKQILEG